MVENMTIVRLCTTLYMQEQRQVDRLVGRNADGKTYCYVDGIKEAQAGFIC